MKCELCSNKAIQKHHISYFPEITIPVCGRCHKFIHKEKPEKYIQYRNGDPEMFYNQKKILHRFGVKI